MAIKSEVVVFIDERKMKGNAVTWGLNLVLHEWYHFAAVVQGEELRFYVNGIPFYGVAPAGDLARADAVFSFGIRDNRLESFCGYLENVRLTEGVLYQGNFFADQTLEVTGQTVLAYDFNLSFKNVIFDRSSSSLNATMTESASLMPGGI